FRPRFTIVHGEFDMGNSVSIRSYYVFTSLLRRNRQRKIGRVDLSGPVEILNGRTLVMRLWINYSSRGWLGSCRIQWHICPISVANIR
ncbi:hypothetical protein PFISCL1PPCAC_20876, partial [Pristionchus fissidentatus]